MGNLFSERLSELLDQRLLSYQELADKIGLKSKTSICKYAKGHVKNVNISFAKTIADFYKVSPVWLVGLQDTKTDCQLLDNNHSLVAAINYKGIKVDEGIIVSNDSLKNTTYTAFKCCDTSMLPTINPDDLLLVELNNKPKTGDLCLISDSNNFMVRKYIKQGSKTILMPLNSEFDFSTFSTDNKNLNKINIIGIVRKLERNSF